MFLPWLIMANIIGILITAIYSIFYTHKIAGASFRIKRDLEMIRKGDLSKKIKLRNRDHLHDVAEMLNLTLEEMREKMGKIAQWASELETSAEMIRHYTSEGEDEGQAREEAIKLAAVVRRIKEELPEITA
jgi:methyl-accepting chemotaxis protein